MNEDRYKLTIYTHQWLKKTKEQKKKLLNAAWKSNLPNTHRPDFAAWRNERQAVQTQGTRYRDCFLWPYIDLEDLTKPRTLLLFMDARGRHQPCEFAAADGEAFHFGVTSQVIVPDFLKKHVMMFTGRTDAATYGQLIPWDDHPGAFNWLHTRK